MSGICAAPRLRGPGVHDFVVYEKSNQVGGVWQHNTYTGLFCDVPSRCYSYPFAPDPDWTRLFASGPEIRSYVERVAHDHDIEAHIRFEAEVEEAEWTSQGRWCVRSTSGEEEILDFVIAATGVLHHPKVPSIPGLEEFGGAVFHSARWDHSVPVDGRRVAVIGNGSSGVQPTKALVPRCAALKLFQRTPQWVLPGRGREDPGPRRRLRRRPRR